MKYKVGDRVRIVSKIEGAERAGYFIREGLYKWLGEVVTIEYVYEQAGLYRVKENEWAWYEKEIAGFAEETTEPPTDRKKVLRDAERTVCQDRKDQYGSLEENFALIAKQWTNYILAIKRDPAVKFELKPHDVAVMMIYLKTARIATGAPKDDNWVDIAGYAACGGELQCKS